jgi:hypothetical protein
MTNDLHIVFPKENLKLIFKTIKQKKQTCNRFPKLCVISKNEPLLATAKTNTPTK